MPDLPAGRPDPASIMVVVGARPRAPTAGWYAPKFTNRKVGGHFNGRALIPAVNLRNISIHCVSGTMIPETQLPINPKTRPFFICF